MRLLRPVLATLLTFGLASCDVLTGSPSFRANSEGAVNRTFEGDGQARQILDLLTTSYALEMEERDRLSISLNREELSAPAPGTYPIGPGFTGGPSDDFGASVTVRDASVGAEDPFVRDEGGTVTIETCTASSVSGRFEITGTLDGEPLTLTGSFDLDRDEQDNTQAQGECR